METTNVRIFTKIHFLAGKMEQYDEGKGEKTIWHKKSQWEWFCNPFFFPFSFPYAKKQSDDFLCAQRKNPAQFDVWLKVARNIFTHGHMCMWWLNVVSISLHKIKLIFICSPFALALPHLPSFSCTLFSIFCFTLLCIHFVDSRWIHSIFFPHFTWLTKEESFWFKPR